MITTCSLKNSKHLTLRTNFLLSEWMNLDEKQSRYLVRILPPSGIISYAVRSITEMQDMKTASIFIGGDMGNPDSVSGDTRKRI